MLGIVPCRSTTPVPIEILDLSRFPILLTLEPPDKGRLYTHRTRFLEEMKCYSECILNGPIPSRHLGWQILDRVALCSPRFSNLKLLRIDYLIFDNRGQYTPPEEYRERVEGLKVPTDWLFMTNAILPGIVAENRVKLEGSIIELTPPITVHYKNIDYSTGIARARYP